MKIILGYLAKWVHAIPRDPATKRFLSEEDGGAYDPAELDRAKTHPKYESEVRGVFGVCVTLKMIDGKPREVAEKMKPFFYTGRTMVSAHARCAPYCTLQCAR